MADRREPKLGTVVQKALASGPVPRDALLQAVQQAGLRRIDFGLLWETCVTHGIADLDGELWVPRGRAAPVAEGPRGRSPPAEPLRGTCGSGRAASGGGGRSSRRRAGPTCRAVPSGWAEVAAGAARALRDGLKTVTNRRTQSDVPLSGGSEAGAAGRRVLMRYEAQGELGVAEGSPATLIVKELTIEVEVVSVLGNVVTLSLPPGTPTAREATLRLDLSWLLTAQSKRLDEPAHGGPGFDAAAALAVVSPERGRVSTAHGRLPVEELDGLNAGQRNAVELALAPTLTWLWGPPGTGKTSPRRGQHDQRGPRHARRRGRPRAHGDRRGLPPAAAGHRRGHPGRTGMAAAQPFREGGDHERRVRGPDARPPDRPHRAISDARAHRPHRQHGLLPREPARHGPERRGQTSPKPSAMGERPTGPGTGVVLRTEHHAFADAVRRMQRRRSGSAPGSGRPGDDCGRCRRMLVRYEQGRAGQPDLRYECPACDRTAPGSNSRRRLRS